MPFDFGEMSRNRADDDARRVYVCECGDVCVETRHSRLIFSPAEFVALLRGILARKERAKTRRLCVLSERKNLFGMILIAVCAVVLNSCAARTATETGAKETERIVTVGGSATEIVYALGAGGQAVGADTSSVFPEEARKLPQVGYQRQLSAEGVLSLKPTLVVMTEDAGPPAANSLVGRSPRDRRRRKFD
jgi:hypothetical protein